MSLKSAGAAVALALLAGCASAPRLAAPVPAKAPASATLPETARDLPLVRAKLPDVGDAALAVAALRRSCPALLERADRSGLTQPADWAPACAAAATADPRTFFATNFVAVRAGNGEGLNTGYYEPELAGSRTRTAAAQVPLYRRPPEVVEVDLGDFTAGLSGKKIRGRIAAGKFVPYFDRAEIDGGALAGRGLELAWAFDPYEAFFLEIQGSGRLRLPDGSIVRIGYDGQNGRDYTGIGKLLRDRGALGPGQATMDGIIGWMRAQPDKGVALMNENRSKIFFRELPPGDPALGPPGALGVPLTPQVSIAVDPRFVTLGAPLWLESRGESNFARVMVAQDTGGAIKGANRLDVFWGAGVDARRIAGGMSATGRTLLLLPLAAATRLGL